MNSSIERLGRFFFTPSKYFIPKKFRLISDPEKYIVDKFIARIEDSKGVQLLLDAGAGSFRYKELLEAKGYQYESQEFEQAFDQELLGKYTYVCDIESLSIATERFDIVICVQVLEHIPNPALAMSELARVLKPGGKLYLTTNFLFPIHGEPYDFFRFSKYGLNHLVEISGLKLETILNRGGFFSFVAKLVHSFPAIPKSWLLYGNATPHGPRTLQPRNRLLVAALIPFLGVIEVLCTILSLVLISLDFFDKKNRFTLGYQLVASKEPRMP